MGPDLNTTRITLRLAYEYLMEGFHPFILNHKNVERQ